MHANDVSAPPEKSAPMLCAVSASGGTGKSAICLVAAYLAARADIKTALVEADLQFGDMGFWLGLDARHSSLAEGREADPIELRENLVLYKAPCFPELAEEVSESVAELVQAVRRENDLVLADTGAFWSGLTADLAVNASVLLLVNDQRPSSVAGNVRASELCSRIGIPAAKRAYVYNRYSTKPRTADAQVKKALGASSLFCLPEGRNVVDELLCAGDVEELIEMENAFVHGVDKMLAVLLPRVGRLYAAGSGRGRGWFS